MSKKEKTAPPDKELVYKKILDIYKKINRKYRNEFIELFTETTTDAHLKMSVSILIQQRMLHKSPVPTREEQEEFIIAHRGHEL